MGNLQTLGAGLCKYLINGLFLEEGKAENLEDFCEAPIDAEFLLDDRHEHVDADRDPDLRLDGILARAIERLDPQVLFDPLEAPLENLCMRKCSRTVLTSDVSSSYGRNSNSRKQLRLWQ